jgi:hypothetical protein
VGSPKQVEWAERIRAGVVGEARALFDRLIPSRPGERGASAADIAKARRAADTAIRELVTSQTSARWWIDGRSTSVRTLVTPYYNAAVRR